MPWRKSREAMDLAPRTRNLCFGNADKIMKLRNSPALLGTALLHLGALTIGLNWLSSNSNPPTAAKGQSVSMRILPAQATKQQTAEAQHDARRPPVRLAAPALPASLTMIEESSIVTSPSMALSADSKPAEQARAALDADLPAQANRSASLAASQGREPTPSTATATPSPSPALIQASLAPEHQPCLAQVTERYYPSLLRERGLQALVTLLVHVDAQGRAAEVKLKQGSGLRLFDEAAHQVAKACRFTPARMGEQSVSSWVEYPVRFSLKAGPL